MITKKQFAAMMDHTIIGVHRDRKDVERMCREALENEFACMYVNQTDVPLARSIIPKGSKTRVGCPVGFPWGTSTTEAKIAEAVDAIDKGANALDVVLNVHELKNGNIDYARKDLKQFVKAVRDKADDVLVKVIIECRFLTRQEKITATELVVESGADYVKQATGETPNYSYLLGDLMLINSVVKGRIGVKASGWVITIEDALSAIEAGGATLIGNDKALEWLKDFDDNRWYEWADKRK
jgi:deoxyribose-phosphate aldolase